MVSKRRICFLINIARLGFEDSKLKTEDDECQNMSSNYRKLLHVCLCSYPNLFTFIRFYVNLVMFFLFFCSDLMTVLFYKHKLFNNLLFLEPEWALSQ